jgi:hypothetical protein
MTSRRLRVSRFLIVPLTLALVALSVAPSLATAATAPVTAHFQPDARIRVLGGTLRGNDIYSDVSSPDEATVTRTVAIGGVARFVITIQNDGTVADSFDVQTALYEAVPGFGVAFYRGWHPRTDITAGEGYVHITTRTLAPGEVYHFRSDVRVSADAERCTGITEFFVAGSNSDAFASDRVTFKVNTPC